MNTAREKLSLSVFVKIFVLATSISSLLLEYDVSQLSIEFVENLCHRHFNLLGSLDPIHSSTNNSTQWRSQKSFLKYEDLFINNSAL